MVTFVYNFLACSMDDIFVRDSQIGLYDGVRLHTLHIPNLLDYLGNIPYSEYLYL